MSPITHLFCGRAVAEVVTKDRRERLWISLAGVAPDLFLMGWAIWRAVKNGATPVSMVSQRADALVVKALRARWRHWFAKSDRVSRGE